MLPRRARSIRSFVVHSCLIGMLGGVGCDLESFERGSEESEVSVEASFELTMRPSGRPQIPGTGSDLWPLSLVTLDGNPGDVTLEMTATDPPGYGRMFFTPDRVVNQADWFTFATPNPDCDVALGDYELTITGTREDGVTATVSGRTTVVLGGNLRARFDYIQDGLAFEFGDSSRFMPCDIDPDIVTWSWSFGDGATSNRPKPTHTYAAPGRYTVELRVTSSTGDSNSIRETVIATATP